MALEAEELRIVDTTGLTRAVMEIESSADVEIELSAAGAQSVALQDSLGLRAPLKPRQQVKEKVTFTGVASGKWIVSIQPHTIDAVWVRIRRE